MNSIAEIIEMVCAKTHVPMAQNAFGNAGVDAVFQIMDAIRNLYRHVEPERVTGRIIVYRLIPRGGDEARLPTGAAADLEGLANSVIQDLAARGNSPLRSDHMTGLE